MLLFGSVASRGAQAGGERDAAVGAAQLAQGRPRGPLSAAPNGREDQCKLLSLAVCLCVCAGSGSAIALQSGEVLKLEKKKEEEVASLVYFMKHKN